MVVTSSIAAEPDGANEPVAVNTPAGGRERGDMDAAGTAVAALRMQTHRSRGRRTYVAGVGVVDAETAAAGTNNERLIYANTMGDVLLALPVWGVLADDIVVMATWPTEEAAGCPLRRFTFQVTGLVNPERERGAYAITFALYDNCPHAGGQKLVLEPSGGFVEGTVKFGDDEDDTVWTIEYIVPPDVHATLPATIWLQLSTDRPNTGVVSGAMPELGYTADVVDFPDLDCNASFGGAPEFPFAGFNVEVYGAADCPAAFPGYRNSAPSRGGISAGSGICMADDIHLQVDSCELVGYDVQVNGNGVYLFALRTDEDEMPGVEIAGTRAIRVLNVPDSDHKIIHVQLPEPVTIPQSVFFSMQANHGGARWTRTCTDAEIGEPLSYGRAFGTADEFFIGDGPCTNSATTFREVTPTEANCHGGFDVTILCAGEPPVGACCDMFRTDDGVCDAESNTCAGGAFDGEPCVAPLNCEGDPVCRDLPEMNCPFSLRQTDMRPTWRAGLSCQACNGGALDGEPCRVDAECGGEDAACMPEDPFGEEDFQCGLAACCTPDGRCENLTEKECFRLPPAYDPRYREWQMGQYCGEDDQRCPIIACVVGTGDCSFARPGEVACGEFGCCSHVCEIDPWCCEVEWDEQCLFEARQANACDRPPTNDDCDGFPADYGAYPIEANSSVTFSNHAAKDDVDDPPFCCHNGWGTVCNGAGAHEGEPCTSASDCWDRECGRLCDNGTRSGRRCDRRPDPDAFCDDGSFPTPRCMDPVCQGNVGATGNECTTDADCNPWLSCDVAGPDPVRGSVGTMWFQFVAADVAARASACASDLTGDSLIQVLGASDHSSRSAACGSLYSIACNDDSDFCRGNRRGAAVCVEDLVPGETYYVEVASKRSLVSDNIPTGLLTLDLQSLPVCPESQCAAGSAQWVRPPDGVVDARSTVRPFHDDNLTGIDRLIVASPDSSQPDCWSLCETNQNEPLHPDYPPELVRNRVTAVESGIGSTVLRLARPLTPGEHTTVVYSDDAQRRSAGFFTFHPGDTNADGIADAADVGALIDGLNGLSLPWGLYSGDCDHSGAVGPPDILCLIDLLNAGWVGTGTGDPIEGSACTTDTDCGSVLDPDGNGFLGRSTPVTGSDDRFESKAVNRVVR